MHPDDLPQLIARSLSQPPEALRQRVLTAARAKWRAVQPSPWWWRARTWGLAAAALIACDILSNVTLSRGPRDLPPDPQPVAQANTPVESPTLLALTRALREENIR
jgi:hypothetical protein